MNSIVGYVLAFAAGLALGYIFFAGLWFTVRRLPSARRPWLWISLSLFLRFGISLAGFYLIARGGHWIRVLFCLAGFIAVRLVMTTGKGGQQQRKEKEETR